MNISYRLKVISSFINEDSIVVDIGCDHALLPIYLVKENKTKIVYAVDNKIGPLNRATLNIEANNLTIDDDTLANGTVTIRDRDTMKQDIVKVEDIKDYLRERVNF